MEKDISSELATWLRRTGYPFQLHAGRALQAAGWHVNYTRWYKDPESGKHREIDLQAITGAVNIGQSSLFLCLSIECKATGAMPWVGLSSRKDGGGRSFVASAPGTMTRRFALAAQLLEVSLPTLLPENTLYVDSVVAGFVADEDSGEAKAKKGRAKEQGDPTSPHSALLQSVTAAKAYDTEFLRLAINTRSELATASLVLPVVLIRGRLFAYTVDDSLHDELKEVDALLASVPTDNEDNSTLVAVVTEEFGVGHWKSMHSSAHDFCVAALPYAGRIANALTVAEHEMAERI